MNPISTDLPGVFVIEPKKFSDPRGEFIKVFHQDTFQKLGLATNFVESYYSTSQKGVIRGMHFQIPPHAHAKLVYVTYGKILDVVLDIRRDSPSFGHYFTAELSDQNRQSIYVPVGCAHGFLSLQDGSCVTYLQTSMHSPECDRGIRFDSFGLDWQVTNPILSERDQAFPTLREFSTPFTYETTN